MHNLYTKSGMTKNPDIPDWLSKDLQIVKIVNMFKKKLDPQRVLTSFKNVLGLPRFVSMAICFSDYWQSDMDSHH